MGSTARGIRASLAQKPSAPVDLIHISQGSWYCSFDGTILSAMIIAMHCYHYLSSSLPGIPPDDLTCPWSTSARAHISRAHQSSMWNHRYPHSPPLWPFDPTTVASTISLMRMSHYHSPLQLCYLLSNPPHPNSCAIQHRSLITTVPLLHSIFSRFTFLRRTAYDIG